VFYPWGGVGFLLLTTRLPIEVTLWPNHPVRFFSPLSLEKNAPACSAFSEFLVEAGSL
jgi:hypothetical protein